VKSLGSLSLRHKMFGVVLLTALGALIVALGAVVGLRLANLPPEPGVRHDHAGRAARPHHSDRAPRSTIQGGRGESECPAVPAGGELRRPVQRAGALFATYARKDEQHAFPKLPEADDLRIEGRDLILFRRIVNDGEILGRRFYRLARRTTSCFDRVLDYLGISAAVLVRGAGRRADPSR